MTRIDVSRPQFDQNEYWGRAQHFFATTNPLNLFKTGQQLEESRAHFFATTNPLNLFKTGQQLEESRAVVERLRNGEQIDGMSETELWRHKQIYDSAFHPETGQKMIIFGRMSAQVPMNMAITGCMLTYYKSNSAAIFWQWFNQSFNAVVNYTNRSGNAPLPLTQLLTAYSLATSGALVTALSLNHLAKKAPPLVGRFVPFLAGELSVISDNDNNDCLLVAAANCVNIPLMRSTELKDGLVVCDENGVEIGKSRIAAKLAIAQVVVSRIAMAAPGMTLPPILMNSLEKRGVLRRMPWIAAPLQVGLCGLFLTFTTPMCCALFPQTASVALSRLEPELQTNTALHAFYNKGL
ncbi:unnamed protein product [Medioppia subpectinata]|uniref:Sidoreflexin n=1 Tax=Medioppia subpectinata TaxID=1979941 RepID=A0A7R9PUH6_9ACAR|nr:unnamed protein product [Medioppia subpectinata]CAG2100783.1 unnamed protein product [Medioppia subpectinata]